MKLMHALVVCSLAGCLPDSGDTDVFTDEEFEIIQTLGTLPDVPPDPTNRYADDPEAAAFGQRLFFERAYSKALTLPGSGLGNIGDAGKVSCTSCHDPLNYYTDTRSKPAMTSLGVSWTNRNTPTLVNTSFQKWGS